jgi:hypothetical protein
VWRVTDGFTSGGQENPNCRRRNWRRGGRDCCRATALGRAFS